MSYGHDPHCNTEHLPGLDPCPPPDPMSNDDERSRLKYRAPGLYSSDEFEATRLDNTADTTVVPQRDTDIHILARRITALEDRARDERLALEERIAALERQRESDYRTLTMLVEHFTLLERRLAEHVWGMVNPTHHPPHDEPPARPSGL